MHKLKKLAHGFTLAELMAVVIIVALLAAISAGYYRKSVEQARFSEGMQAASAVAEALNRAYFEDELSMENSPVQQRKLKTLDVVVSSRDCQTPSDYCAATHYFEVAVGTGGVVRAYHGTTSSYDYYIEIYPHYYNTASLRDSVACVGSGEAGKTFCESMGYTACTGNSCTMPTSVAL